MLTYSKANYEQRDDQLGYHNRRKNLDADGFLQASFVDQHLGDHTEAGQRQHSGQTQGVGEPEVQAQIEEDIRGDRQGHQQG